MNFLKKHIYTILTAVVVTVLMSVVSFSSYAVEESSYTSVPSESSEVITSSEDSTLFSSTVSESSVEQSSTQSSFIQESSTQSTQSSEVVSEPQSSAEPEPSITESSVPEETSTQESSTVEVSDEESSEESTEVSFTDPLSALKYLEAVLPIDRGYTPPENSTQNSTQSSIPNSESSTVSEASTVSEISKTESKILNAPPVPTDEETPKQTLTQQSDNSSFLIGIIIWSVIGVAVTALLIVILNLKDGKGRSDSFNHGRYSSRKHYK